MPQLITHLADTVGDGTGTTNAIGDYDTTPTKFMFKPNRTCAIYRVIVAITDAAARNGDRYGDLAGGLPNGVRLYVEGANGIEYELTGFPVKTNSDWKAHCHDMELPGTTGGNDTITVRWTFAKHGAPVRLEGGRGQFISVSLTDDMTGLIAHTFLFEGHYLTT